MGCKTPNVRHAIYLNDGKSITKGFMPYAKVKNFEQIREFNEHMQKLHNSDPGIYPDERLQIIPCGHCLSCQMNHAREWAMRCIAEANEYEKNWFITLTYDGYHVPWNENSLTLNKKDTVAFMKKLRRHMEYHYGHEGIKFFLCGEYGGKGRPHYHAILFNCPLDEKQFKRIPGTQNLWTSEELEKIWGNGMVSIGQVTAESAAYVARYVTKKHYGAEAKEYYETEHKEPEFLNMSRKEGIGLKYFNEHYQDIYKCDEMLYKGKKTTIKVKPVKYYDRKYDIIDHEDMEKIKAERQRAAAEALKLKMSKTTKPEKEQLWDELEILADKLKKSEGYARKKVD